MSEAHVLDMVPSLAQRLRKWRCFLPLGNTLGEAPLSPSSSSYAAVASVPLYQDSIRQSGYTPISCSCHLLSSVLPAIFHTELVTGSTVSLVMPKEFSVDVSLNGSFANHHMPK